MKQVDLSHIYMKWILRTKTTSLAWIMYIEHINQLSFFNTFKVYLCRNTF